jgi:hypothetical protein
MKMTSITINIGIEYYSHLRKTLRQFKIKHGPFYRTYNRYYIELYPTKYNTLFLITMSGTDMVIDKAK